MVTLEYFTDLVETSHLISFLSKRKSNFPSYFSPKEEKELEDAKKYFSYIVASNNSEKRPLNMHFNTATKFNELSRVIKELDYDEYADEDELILKALLDFGFTEILEDNPPCTYEYYISDDQFRDFISLGNTVYFVTDDIYVFVVSFDWSECMFKVYEIFPTSNNMKYWGYL